MQERLDELKRLLSIENKEERIAQIKQAMQQAEFWSDHQKAGQIAQELTQLQEIVDNYYFVQMNPDEPKAIKLFAQLERASLYTGLYDDANSILSIHAGAGGTESQDWANMLLRMYQRYVERQNWQVSLLEQSLGEEAGIKSAMLEIKGHQVYGNLKSEAGVHRLVRISPFDSDKARHTSFALIEVTPIVDKVEGIEIKPDELKIDVYRAGGHGGQSVNTTDSAVRVTHLPTNIVVTVQNERSQLQNKEKAMQILTSRLLLRQLEEQRLERVELRGEHVSAQWGNQIRSYVLHPYQMVKDHRTDVETSNTQAVLDGDISALVEGYLRWQANLSGKLKLVIKEHNS